MTSTPSILAEAPLIVRIAIQRGLCSAPVFTPPLSNNQIFRIRMNMRGLTARGSKPADSTTLAKRGFHSIRPTNPKELLTEFLTRHEAEFTTIDFMNFASRSGIEMQNPSAQMFLMRAAGKGVLTLIKRGKPAHPSIYKKATQ